MLHVGHWETCSINSNTSTLCSVWSKLSQIRQASRRLLHALQVENPGMHVDEFSHCFAFQVGVCAIPVNE